AGAEPAADGAREHRGAAADPAARQRRGPRASRARADGGRGPAVRLERPASVRAVGRAAPAPRHRARARARAQAADPGRAVRRPRPGGSGPGGEPAVGAAAVAAARLRVRLPRPRPDGSHRRRDRGAPARPRRRARPRGGVASRAAAAAHARAGRRDPGAARVVRYLARRFAHSLLLLFGVSLLSFALFELAPGDFWGEMRMNPQISRAAVEAARARYGMDQPLPVRYLRWLGSLARGEMGYSFAYGTPVLPLLVERARNTLALAGAALLLAWLLAIPLGVWFAARRGRLSDRLGAAATSALLATPDLVVALLLLLLAVRTGAFPV